MTIPRVTKFSTHEFFHPRIFSRLLTSFAYRASGVTKFKTTKINSEDPRQLFTKICTPENYPPYGISYLTTYDSYVVRSCLYTPYIILPWEVRKVKLYQHANLASSLKFKGQVRNNCKLLNIVQCHFTATFTHQTL